MVKKISWALVPTEEVTPQMRRKLVYGKKVMVAKMKFKDGFAAVCAKIVDSVYTIEIVEELA